MFCFFFSSFFFFFFFPPWIGRWLMQRVGWDWYAYSGGAEHLSATDRWSREGDFASLLSVTAQLLLIKWLVVAAECQCEWRAACLGSFSLLLHTKATSSSCLPSLASAWPCGCFFTLENQRDSLPYCNSPPLIFHLACLTRNQSKPFQRSQSVCSCDLLLSKGLGLFITGSHFCSIKESP